MKTVWKWILGILIVLLVVAAAAAVIFTWRNHTALAFGPAGMMPGFDARMPHDFGYRHGPWMDGGPGWDRPMFGHPRDGFMPFFGGLFIIGGFLKLAFFGALLYGAYWLGKRNARVVLDPAPARPAPSSGRRVAKK